ncbi:LIC10965 family protein [Leptospira stimsonii]|uniref:LIC10965 family protein n=1 Tax=Leptospira stimsonii TaxID=2202203 RepID=UPI003CCFEE9E
MLIQRLKVGILLILLLSWMGREIHTHSEKDFRIDGFSDSSYTSQVEAKHSPACAICQFQRNISSLWNPDFFVKVSSLLFGKEEFLSSTALFRSLKISPIHFGRAPPFCFSI